MNSETNVVVADDWDSHWASFDASASANPAQHYRHRLVAGVVRRRRPRRLLDIGSGQGDLLERVHRSLPGTSLFGLELSHRRHYTPQSIRQLLRSAGFIVVRVDRAGFPFFNVYRLIVIGRGTRLAADVADGSTSRFARAGMLVFEVLFRFNLRRSRWGWQNVAIARWPAGHGQTPHGG